MRAPGPKTTGLHSGLVGDQIFDTEHHGGDDQAVYAYAREDYDWWQARLSRRLANGLFGENLTTEGVDVNGAVIGERWRIGRRLVLQPTFGRIPCVTFQRKMGEPRWVKTFTRASRPGAYLRVLEPGEVWAGDPVTVEDRPAHGVTIAQAFRAYMTEPELLPELVETDGLARRPARDPVGAAPPAAVAVGVASGQSANSASLVALGAAPTGCAAQTAVVP